MVSQNVLNLVDTAMVGTQGDAALAAVGLGSFANFVAMAFITGMSAGVQAMSARRKGEGREDTLAVPLNGGLLLALGLSVVASAVLWALTPVLFPLLSPDPAVVEIGVPYLRARLLGMAAVGLNFAFRGYWNGVGRSGNYLMASITIHSANILLNYGLIHGHFGLPQLGAVGAGVATTISVYLGTAVYGAQAWREARGAGFLRGLPDRETLRTMVRLAVPAGVQQELIALGFLAYFRVVAAVGTQELAAAQVLQNLYLVAMLPGLGLGLAGASLVGQALGRKDASDAKRWGWEVAGTAAVVMVGLGLPGLFFPEPLLAVFLQDPATRALAVLPLRLAAASLLVDAVGIVLLNAMLGAGAARTSLAVGAGCQWLLGLPLAILLGPVAGYGLVGLWASQVIWRTVQAVTLALLWRRGDWARARA
jgi:putative MATE family efflux protein